MIECSSRGVLYKIDLVFFGRDGRCRLEVTMQMALVEITAFGGGIGDIQPLLQTLSSLFDATIHSVGVRGYAGRRFKLAQQGVGVGAEFSGQRYQGHPLKGPLSMNKLLRPRKKSNFFLTKVELSI